MAYVRTGNPTIVRVDVHVYVILHITYEWSVVFMNRLTPG